MVESIRAKFGSGKYEYSRHAVDQMIWRGILEREVQEAIASAEVIEDYPNDKYGPSCLLLGTTRTGRALHVQCSYPQRPLVKIVTVYEPDPGQWTALRWRR